MKLSILDQSPIAVGKTAHEAVQATLDLAEAADKWGYTRYWLAEHHSSRTLADASPEMVLAAMSSRTNNIRLGSGGVMLSHYNIVSNIQQIGQAFALDQHDRILGILPFFHSFGFTGTLWLPPLLLPWSLVESPADSIRRSYRTHSPST